MATVHGVYKDFHPTYIKLVYGQHKDEEEFQNALKETNKNFETYLKKLNGILAENQFMCGELTWMDFALADFFQTLGLLSEEILKPFPKLVEYQKRVWDLPELKDYFSSDRFKERPCNNYSAHWK